MVGMVLVGEEPILMLYDFLTLLVCVICASMLAYYQGQDSDWPASPAGGFGRFWRRQPYSEMPVVGSPYLGSIQEGRNEYCLVDRELCAVLEVWRCVFFLPLTARAHADILKTVMNPINQWLPSVKNDSHDMGYNQHFPLIGEYTAVATEWTRILLKHQFCNLILTLCLPAKQYYMLRQITYAFSVINIFINIILQWCCN